MDKPKYIFFILLLFLAAQCKTQKMKKYEWLPTECAPKNYPMMIVQGDLFFPGEGSVYIPDNRVTNNGWSAIGSTHIVGEDLKPIPDSLYLIFLSLTERKFYGLNVGLPQRAMIDAFEEGVMNRSTGKKETYSDIVIGMAPGGRVAVWLSGMGEFKEVAFFTAEEVDVDESEFFPERRNSMAEYVPGALADAFRSDKEDWPDFSDTSPKRWDRYRDEVDWRLKLVGSAEFQGIKVDYFNGEKAYAAMNEEVALNDQLLERMPRSFDVHWLNEAGELHFGKVDFDELELYDAFRHFSNTSESSLREFIVTFDRMDGTLKVAISNGEEIYQFKLAKMKVTRRG